MITIRLLLFSYFVFGSLKCISQNAKDCDSVYRKISNKANYIGGRKAIQNYIYNQTVEIIKGSLKESTKEKTFNWPDTLIVDLVISNLGIVETATIKESTICFSKTSYSELMSKIVGMKKWKPAKKRRKSVCSVYTIRIIYRWY